jgi:hypothetical protein
MKVKRVLYIVLLVVLFIPLAETILGFKVAKSLIGVIWLLLMETTFLGRIP